MICPLYESVCPVSLEEARRRGGAPAAPALLSPRLPPPEGAIAAAAAAATNTQLRPQGDVKPKYIEVAIRLSL